MKMKVKHGYLIELYNILARPAMVFKGDCSGTVAYKIYMNRSVAKTYAESYAQAFPEDPEWNKYALEHDAVLQEAGIATVTDLNKRSPEQRADISKKLAEIDAKYKEVIEKHNALEAERKKTMNEDIEVELYPVLPSDVHIRGMNAWKVWDTMFNDGNGIIREPVAGQEV